MTSKTPCQTCDPHEEDYKAGTREHIREYLSEVPNSVYMAIRTQKIIIELLLDIRDLLKQIPESDLKREYKRGYKQGFNFSESIKEASEDE